MNLLFSVNHDIGVALSLLPGGSQIFHNSLEDDQTLRDHWICSAARSVWGQISIFVSRSVRISVISISIFVFVSKPGIKSMHQFAGRILAIVNQLSLPFLRTPCQNRRFGLEFVTSMDFQSGFVKWHSKTWIALRYWCAGQRSQIKVFEAWPIISKHDETFARWCSY